jgi:hypothetical protein
MNVAFYGAGRIALGNGLVGSDAQLSSTAFILVSGWDAFGIEF